MNNDAVYSLEIIPEALRDLENIHKNEAKRIVEKLTWLATNVGTIAHEELQGNSTGYYRYRIDNYRAIYFINEADKVVVVDMIGHRKNIYDE
jgi:mRNA interferase RelE/StbE